MENKKFNWLIIGTGRIAKKVAKEINKSSELNLYACYSRTIEKSEKFAKQNKCILFNSLEEALKDEKIEAVYIATPHAYHYKIMLECLKNNKPVLCEKAFCINKKQAKKIFEISKEKQIYVNEAMWTMFNPITKEIRKIKETSKYGKIKTLNASMCYSAKLSKAPKRTMNIKDGGGALLDAGVYVIAYSNMLFGKPKKMEIECKKDRNNVDKDIKLNFYFEDNTYSNLECSLSKFTLCKAKAKFEKAKILLPFVFYKPKIAKIYENNNNKIKLKANRSYIYEFEKAARDIREGKIESEEFTHQMSIDLLEICDEIRENLNLKYPHNIEEI